MLIFVYVSLSYVCLCYSKQNWTREDRVDYEGMSGAYKYYAMNINRLLCTPPEYAKAGAIATKALNEFNGVLHRILLEVEDVRYDAVKFGRQLATEDDYPFMTVDVKNFTRTYKRLFQSFAPFDEYELYEELNVTRNYINKIKTFPYPELDSINRSSEESYYTDYLRDDWRDMIQKAAYKW